MNNEVLKAIRERRSLRRFKGEQVGDDALKAVLEAGTWAPTAFGKQDPWIVAVQNEALRARLTAMNARVMGTESDPYYGAPTVVLVFASAQGPRRFARTGIDDGCRSQCRTGLLLDQPRGRHVCHRGGKGADA